MTSKTKWLLIVGAVVLTFISVSFYQWTQVHNRENTEDNPQSLISTSSSLEVTQKSAAGEPDLVVSNRYVAEINGKRIEAPVATTVDQSTAKVTTEIDVSPLVDAAVPDWEVGTGVGCNVDGDVYIPVSIQRNYKPDRAVMVEVHLDPAERMQPKGVEIQHKWMF